MANRLTVHRLALLAAAAAMLGGIHSAAQAAGEIDCNSLLVQLELMRGDHPVSHYQECLPGALKFTYSDFTGKDVTPRRGVAGRPAQKDAASGKAREAAPSGGGFPPSVD